MISLKELLETTAKVTVEYGGHQIEVEFYPNRVTLEFLSGNPDALTQIVYLVKWWNIEDDQGQVDVEKTARQLPVQLLTLILEKIVESLSLKTEKN